MYEYQVHNVLIPQRTEPNEVVLVASGDLRLSANQTCWPAQEEMERKIAKAFSEEGLKVIRGHNYNLI